MQKRFDNRQYQKIFSSGNFQKLKRSISFLTRHKSWVGSEGFSPLHLGACYDKTQMCRFLLEEGITPNVIEPFTGKTAVHIAAYLGLLDVVKVLRDFGADLSLKDHLDCAPIHYAAMGKHKEMILFFLQNHIKTSLQSVFGNVLDILIRKKCVELVDFFSNINGVEALDTEYFFNDFPDRSLSDVEWTPFHSAAVSGQIETFKMLRDKFPYLPVLEKPALSYRKIGESTTPLDLAILEGHDEIVGELGVEQESDEYRKRFMARNWYETDFPKRKELCNAIRYRDIEKIDQVVEKQGVEILFQRQEKSRSEKFFQTLELPNALDFANYMYALEFFDYLIEKRIEIPRCEFSTHERLNTLFFNWALMEVHPFGEGFIKKMGGGENYE